ncbi:unnamed protein product [Trichobilharzia szidati]|nr:unnamed protein product [Trichobilharzia szidati]
MEVRRRNVGLLNERIKPAISQRIHELDIFPKLPAECKKSTWAGGLVSILTFCCIFWLLLMETWRFIDPPVRYSYEVDKQISGKVKVNIDIVVASLCDAISMDVVDTVGSSLVDEEEIQYIPVSFELNPSDEVIFRNRQLLAGSLRSKHHAIQDRLWKYSFKTNPFKDLDLDTINKKVPDGQNPDACRIIGTVYVKKVEGNIHILLGKPLRGLGNLHLHIAPLSSQVVRNFSHRIYHFSFGERRKAQIYPLEATESITDVSSTAFQYFLTMVPTHVIHPFEVMETYQYAATAQNRTIDHAHDSHGIPGIFFIYDTFPLVVKVIYDRELFGTFIARLAAIAGGIYATVAFLREILSSLPDALRETRLGRQLDSAWTRRKRNLHNKLVEILPNGLEKTGLLKPPTETILNPDSDT